MECLKDLYLEETGIRELHSSVENLTMLRWLFLHRFINLEFVPNNIYNLSCLEFLDLSECPKLESLPALSAGFHCKIQVDLSYKSMSKVPDWLCGLSSLPMLDPIGIVNGRSHVSMERLSNMFLFSRGNGEKSEFTKVGDFTSYLLPCQCAPFYNSKFSKFRYCGCSRFDETKRFNLAAEFLRAILCEALLNVIEEIVCPRINLYFPGNKIPWWFVKSKGSSIHIDLPPYWLDTDFLGFAFCFVVEFDHYCFDLKHLNYHCEYDFKTNHGESRRFSWSFLRPGNVEQVTDIKFLNSDHMFVGYLHEDYLDFHNAVEVSFEFRLEQLDSEPFVNNGKCEVKECGIRMLYIQDAEDFGADDYFSQNVSTMLTSTVQFTLCAS